MVFTSPKLAFVTKQFFSFHYNIFVYFEFLLSSTQFQHKKYLKVYLNLTGNTQLADYVVNG